MISEKRFALICMLLAVSVCVDDYYSDYREGISVKKGLTLQATVWPQ